MCCFSMVIGTREKRHNQGTRLSPVGYLAAEKRIDLEKHAKQRKVLFCFSFEVYVCFFNSFES